MNKIKFEISKVVSNLTAKKLSEGYYLVDTDHIGLEEYIQLFLFSKPQEEKSNAIIVKTISVGFELYQVEIYDAILEGNEKPFYLGTVLDEASDKKLIAKLYYLKHHGISFSISEEELETIQTKREERIKSCSYNYTGFHVKSLKKIKGFKRQGVQIKRLYSDFLEYEILGDKSGFKRITFTVKR